MANVQREKENRFQFLFDNQNKKTLVGEFLLREIQQAVALHVCRKETPLQAFFKHFGHKHM